MQSESRRGGREIVVSFGPRQRPQVESSGGRFRDSGRSRHVFRVTYCTVLAEWTTALIAVGLLSFYLYAILDTRTDKQRDNIQYKLLVAYVFMSAYMRLCYVLTTISKTYLLMQQGPCESSTLPGQQHINTISGFMFMVEPAHFICLCWITHVAFPINECDENVTRFTCTALHVASTIFVSMWILTGLAVIVLVVTVTFFDRNRQGSRWWEDTLGNQAVESSLRLTPLPDPLREQIIGNLPTTRVPPPDGEPCAICFDVDTQDQWRILPCGHRFHPACVDEWIKKQRGTCPTCRHDPTQAQSTGDEETGNRTNISVTQLPTAHQSELDAAAAGTGGPVSSRNAPVAEAAAVQEGSSPLETLSHVWTMGQQMVLSGTAPLRAAASSNDAQLQSSAVRTSSMDAGIVSVPVAAGAELETRL
mmetsp:Transcript_56686/g.83193  ORF Transcript_56686/g.83193 Transcript_56686/m.83193 type:complete len:419 (-) Transcript_56686:798-2054(-)